MTRQGIANRLSGSFHFRQDTQRAPSSAGRSPQPNPGGTMPIKFDPETLERFRRLTADEVCREVTEAVQRVPGGAGSEDFLDALETLVDEGILSWDQIENVEVDEER